jgi:UDP-glucose:(glucosyl)LPS alpha-1,2-glucosyltransferase
MIKHSHDLIEIPDIAKKAHGGTEMAMERLYDGTVSREVLEQFQIIPTRVRGLKEDKYRILWIHETPGDAEVQHLANGGWRKFHRLVFVSNWQMQHFIVHFGIPWSKCRVMLHGIHPIDLSTRGSRQGPIKIIYHSSPNRGLNILLPAFDRLARQHDIHLDVFSSFKLYGWEDQDRQFDKLYEFAKAHPRIAYHSMVKDHGQICKALADAEIFAYPSTWPENACLCLMEAMSAGLLCVHSNYGALFETAANWTMMYGFHENMNKHANIFAAALDQAIRTVRSPEMLRHCQSQKAYADAFYSWPVRARQWESWLRGILNANEPRALPPSAPA